MMKGGIIEFLYFFCQSHPVEARHANIEQDEIGMFFFYLGEGSVAIIGFANGDDIINMVQQPLQSFTCKLLIVNDEDLHSGSPLIR